MFVFFVVSRFLPLALLRTLQGTSISVSAVKNSARPGQVTRSCLPAQQARRVSRCPVAAADVPILAVGPVRSRPTSAQQAQPAGSRFSAKHVLRQQLLRSARAGQRSTACSRLDGLLLAAGLMALQKTLPGLVCSAAPLAQSSPKHTHLPTQSFTHWPLDVRPTIEFFSHQF